MRRHNSGILAISVLSTNMAVLGRDNRLSLWVLGMVNTQHQSQHFALLAAAAHEMEGLVSLLVSQSHICDIENQSRPNVSFHHNAQGCSASYRTFGPC